MSHVSYATPSTTFGTQAQLLPHMDGTPRRGQIWATGPTQATPEPVTTAPQQQQMRAGQRPPEPLFTLPVQAPYSPLSRKGD